MGPSVHRLRNTDFFICHTNCVCQLIYCWSAIDSELLVTSLDFLLRFIFSCEQCSIPHYWRSLPLTGYCVFNKVICGCALSIADYIPREDSSVLGRSSSSIPLVLEDSLGMDRFPLACFIQNVSPFILLHEKFLQFDWLRAVVFQLNLKYLHVKITNLPWVVVKTNNSMICTWYLA